MAIVRKPKLPPLENIQAPIAHAICQFANGHCACQMARRKACEAVERTAELVIHIARGSL